MGPVPIEFALGVAVLITQLAFSLSLAPNGTKKAQLIERYTINHVILLLMTIRRDKG
jgi:hypothetical protein